MLEKTDNRLATASKCLVFSLLNYLKRVIFYVFEVCDVNGEERGQTFSIKSNQPILSKVACPA